MFCPKCGNEAFENQKFCKSCGTNLKLIYGALDNEGHNKGPFGIDIEGLARDAKEFAESWKSGWGEVGVVIGKGHEKTTSPVKSETKSKPAQPRLPKPKEWLPYSWQHNLKYGLISLFSGAGLGAFLFYLGKTAIENGAVRSIEEAAGRSINGLEQLIAMIWLISAIPILKGVAQIFYAAFFAESMSTLSERFLPPPVVQQEPQSRHDTAPQERSSLGEAPASVTEHTTHLFEDSPASLKRESQ